MAADDGAEHGLERRRRGRAVHAAAGRGDALEERAAAEVLHDEDEPAWKSNLQPDFNVNECDSFDARSSAVLRELDESNRFVQKSAESTSI